jgi:hypothetical protein
MAPQSARRTAGFVERRLQVVHLHHADEAGRVEHPDAHVAGAAEQVELVVVGILLPILFAGDERIGGGGGVRHDAPLDAVEVHDLGPRVQESAPSRRGT